MGWLAGSCHPCTPFSRVKVGACSARWRPLAVFQPVSTLLNGIGFNRNWIEKCLAHEDGRSSRSIYNKAEYAEQRGHMLQEWANMVDAWIHGQTCVPKLMPENVVVPVLIVTV